MSTRKQKRILLWGASLLLTLIAIPLLWTLFLYSTGASWWGQYRLGLGNLRTLQHTERVEVFRVNPDQGAPNLPRVVNRVVNYAVTAQGQDLNAAQIRQLTSIILKSANRGPSLAVKSCGLEPSIGFRFWRGEQSLDIAVTYQCNVFEMRAPKKAILDFDANRVFLVKLAKEAFPEDEEIQRLNESQ